MINIYILKVIVQKHVLFFDIIYFLYIIININQAKITYFIIYFVLFYFNVFVIIILISF